MRYIEWVLRSSYNLIISYRNMYKLFGFVFKGLYNFFVLTLPRFGIGRVNKVAGFDLFDWFIAVFEVDCFVGSLNTGACVLLWGDKKLRLGIAQGTQ